MIYTFRPLKESDITSLVALFKNAFNIDISINYLKGKFSFYANLKKHFSFIAIDETNTIVGLYAIFPYYVCSNNKTILAGQVGDIMIHKNHRKSPNLFQTLANKAHENAKQEGMAFIFTYIYGKKGSYPLFSRLLGFSDSENYIGYNIKIHTFPISNTSSKVKFIKPFYGLYYKFLKFIVFRVNKKDGFQNIYNNKPGIIKDMEFFKYKNEYSDAEVWEVNKVRFFIKMNKDGSLGIGDVDSGPPERIKSALNRIKLFAFFAGIRILQFEMTKNHILSNLLSKKHSMIQTRHLLHLDFADNIDVSKIIFTFSELDTF